MPTVIQINATTKLKLSKQMELVIAAQMDMSQTSTWLTVIKSASIARGIQPKVDLNVLNVLFTLNHKVKILIVPQIFAIKIPSLYRQVNVKYVKRDKSQTSFGEDNALLPRETKFAMIGKLS